MTLTGAAAAADAATESASARRLPIATIALGLAVLLGLVWLGREAGSYVPRFAEWVDELGAWGPGGGACCPRTPA